MSLLLLLLFLVNALLSMKSSFFLLLFSVNALTKQRTKGLRLLKNSQFLFSFHVFILEDEENACIDRKKRSESKKRVSKKFVEIS